MLSSPENQSTVAIFSDHGEELGEEGLFNHRLSLDERLLHVPFMIRLPGGRDGGSRIGEPVALLDVLPTVLDAAGIEPLSDARGQSLWNGMVGPELSEDRYVFAESPARAVAAMGPGGGVQFTGLAPHSPFLGMMLETAALTGPAFETTMGERELSRAREAMVSWRRSLPASPENQGLLTAERIRVLRESGYWGGDP